MRGKMLQKIIALFLVMILTMTNFIMLGSNIAIAVSETVQGQTFETNNKNVEFGAYFKNEKGEQVSSLDIKSSELETNLYLYLNVKNEGYIRDAQIKLENANFEIKEAENSYINSISGSTIILNQINTGRPVEIELKIRFDRNEAFDVSLLDKQTSISLEAIYRDSTERDIKINATKNVKLNLISENSSIDTSLEIITNKILNISGENKRVIQLSLNVGLKDNAYPVKEITGQVEIPSIDGKMPQVSGIINLNSMTNGEYKYKNGIFEFSFKNNPTDKNLIWWKESGRENLIITCIYDESVEIENNIAKTNVTMTLYNDEVLKTENLETVIDNTEKESVVTSSTTNSDSVIYKGKLNSSIDREFSTTHIVSVNMIGVTDKLEIAEQNKLHTEQIDSQENITPGVDFNYVYKSTILNKQEIDKLLGEDGKLEIKDDQNNLVTTIDKNTQADESGNIVIDYGEGKTGIVITTTEPVECGKLTIQHNKIIKANTENLLRDKTTLSSQLFVRTNLNQNNMTSVAFTRLEESQTEVELQIDKKELSTILENNVEIKAILKSKDEKNDLFNAPTLRINFPESIETININRVELAYEDELKIKNYALNGKTLVIELEGKQTQYKDLAIEGANVIINATLKLNRRIASQDTAITIDYTNGSKTGNSTTPVKIVAPTDVTTINSIPELSIDEIEQNATSENKIAVNADIQTITPQVQIINNKSVAIENIRILGTFPTDNDKNSMGIVLTEAMTIANAKVYYTENVNATEDITNVENGWQESIINPDKVQKYLIVVDRLEPQAEIIASYKAEIPAKLEYNQDAIVGYMVTYIDSQTETEGTVKATNIKLTTGKGPIAEANLSVRVGNSILQNNNTVMSGEVINYTVEISNTGTEEINNAKIVIPVPEGTKYVKPKDSYEYIGAGYYEEVDTRNIEENIEKLAIGEKITKNYEIRVDKDIEDGHKLTLKCNIEYSGVSKESGSIELIVKSGNIRATVKRVTDRQIPLYEGGSVSYFAIIENTSNEAIDNVIVKTNLPENVQVENVQLLTGMEEEDIGSGTAVVIDGTTEPKDVVAENGVQDNIVQVEAKTSSQEIAYESEINIGRLEAGEKKILNYNILILKGINKIDFFVEAIQGNNTYRSNLWTDTINDISINMAMTSNIQGTYIASGDVIEYTITIKNNSDAETTGLVLKDSIPSQISIDKITVDGTEMELPDSNDVVIPLLIEEQKEKIVKITGVIDYSDDRTEAESITNKAIAENDGEEIASVTLTHIIEPDINIDNDNNDGNGNNDDNENNNEENNTGSDNEGSGNVANGTFVISGIAFEDTNSNGEKDINEKYLEGIKAKLLNVETGEYVKDTSGNILEASTNSDGIYIFNRIPKGNYIVIFEYDTSAYMITKYKVQGIAESENSDVMNNKITIDGQEKDVTSTDIIKVESENVSGINIGLVKLQNFDLKLEKFVNKVSIQSALGTTVREYSNETMAKLELDAKVINGATAIVEYNIRITNVGEVEGYVKKIVDYMANDYSFNSEINKDWYQAGNNIYNISLANEKILPGESKDIKLTLIKNLTDNNIGLINNTAEIAEDYNELGINDSNSIPENNVSGENDMGSADVIISVRTGAEIIINIIFYIMIALIIVAVIVIPIMKKTKKNVHKFDKI